MSNVFINGSLECIIVMPSYLGFTGIKGCLCLGQGLSGAGGWGVVGSTILTDPL